MDEKTSSFYDYVRQYLAAHEDPKAAWIQSLADRRVNPDPQLANAEHFLWNNYYAQKGPIQAAGGLLTPIGYYLGKKTGLLGGRSPATLDQLQAGILGAFRGMSL